VPAQETQSQGEDSEERESDSTDEDSESEDSPNPEDTESSAALARTFNNRARDLILHVEQLMQDKTEQCEEYINQFVQERNEDRSLIEESELMDYDEVTRREVGIQRDLCHRELNDLAVARDDALDLMDHHSQSSVSDYGSDSGEDTRVYNNIDNNEGNIRQSLNTEIDNITQRLETVGGDLNSLESRQINNSSNPASENVQLDSQLASDLSNILPGDNTGDNSKKRKRSDSLDEGENKKRKLDDSSERSGESDNQSPLDYVLDKQQSEMMDITDDIE